MRRLAFLPMLLLAAAAPAAGPGPDTPAGLIAGYAAEAGAPASAERGSAFFAATHAGGKPDTPSCTSCHTANPRDVGRTRAGKAIEPMASSVNPARYTDKAFVEKWFGRNCDSVLGRACAPGEKADFIAYMSSL